jgi:hypothetical protein
METRGHNALVATLVVLGLIIGAPAFAADEALGGIDLPCSPKTGQRIVYRMTQVMTDEYGSSDKAANTVAYDYLVGPDHIEGRITNAGGTLPFTFRLSKNFELEKIVLDNPGSMSEDGLVLYKRIYGPLFEQANAFCGQRWAPGESRRIDVPLAGVESSMSARLLRVGRFYGRRAAQFEVTVTGQMTGQIVSPQGQGEMAGSGTAWSDVETGVILDSVLVSEAVINGPDGVPVVRFKVKEERRLDTQMTRF